MIFFTADTHFCHHNIIKHCRRPFADVDEMNFTLIKNWNKLVTRQDEVYILGDFVYRGSGRDANAILAKLNGKKYLVKGNHEQYLSDPEFKPAAFEWIKDYHFFRYEQYDFALSHYPMLSWHKSHRGSIHLYGHVHNIGKLDKEFGEKLKMLGPRAVNAGVDVHKFYPVSVYQVIETAVDKRQE